MYDLCIVGAGMIGAAAARHASTDPEVRVCLIGPTEPQDTSAKSTRDIFGCHYDEGRITRSCDPDPVWATLAKESIKRYRDIERDSGVSFYSEVGSLITAGPNNSDYLENVKQTAKHQHVEMEEINPTEISNRFPYLNLDADADGVFEKDNAGHISPRKLVEAQKVIAGKQGCEIIDDIVKSVTRITHQDGSFIMRVMTEGGSTLMCKAVLLATGSFTNFRELLPGIQPKQQLFGITVGLVEVDKEYLEKLQNMPTVICKGHTSHQKSGPPVTFYLLPPIQYPNGRFYLKLGRAHENLPNVLKTGSEVRQWFLQRGDTKTAEAAANLIASLFKGLKLKSWHGDNCVVMETPTLRPYIDTVHAQLGVAIGGNGFAAKSSDEIGRLAADMMTGRWRSSLSRDLFKLTLENDSASNKTQVEAKAKL